MKLPSHQVPCRNPPTMVKVFAAGAQAPCWGEGVPTEGRRTWGRAQSPLAPRWKVSVLQVSIAGRWSVGKVLVLGKRARRE